MNAELTCTEPPTLDKSFDLAESTKAFLMTELMHATTACLVEILAHCDESATIWPLEQVGWFMIEWKVGEVEVAGADEEGLELNDGLVEGVGNAVGRNETFTIVGIDMLWFDDEANPGNNKNETKTIGKTAITITLVLSIVMLHPLQSFF